MLKFRRSIYSSALLSVMVALLCSFALVASATAKGGGANGGPPADSPWKGAQKFKQRIVKALDLTPEQSKLHDTMHITRRAFMEKACSDAKADGCKNSKLRKRVFHLFRAELAAEKPDFAGAAAKAKSEYHGKFKAEYDAMVDARAAFMGSLTEAQRDKLLDMRPRGGKRGGMK